MGIDGELEDEELEDSIPDVFQLHVSKVDPVRNKVHRGVIFAELVGIMSRDPTIR